MNNEHWKHQTEKKDKQLTQISKKIGNKDLITSKQKTKQKQQNKSKKTEKTQKTQQKQQNIKTGGE